MKNKKKEDPAARMTLPLPGSKQYAATAKAVDQQVATIEANPDLANHADVQAAVAGVKAQNAKVNKVVTDLGTAHAAVSTLETQRGQESLMLRLLHTNLEALLNITSAGNKQAALAWGGKIVSRTTLPASTDAPIDASAATGTTPGTVLAKCKAERGVICYLVQVGTDPANPQAWPAPTIAGGARHILSGLTTGQKVYVRMAIVRRGGVQGQWSGVLEAIVR
jgi:hypothetical protein